MFAKIHTLVPGICAPSAVVKPVHLAAQPGDPAIPLLQWPGPLGEPMRGITYCGQASYHFAPQQPVTLLKVSRTMRRSG